MTSFRALFLFASSAWLVPNLGWAQVVAQSNMTQTEFNAADCSSSEPLEVSFVYTGAYALGAQYDLFTATAVVGQEATVCANSPSNSSLLVDGESLPVDGIVELPGDQDLSIADLLANSCDSTGQRATLYLCMRVTSPYSTYGEGGGLPFVIDTEIPGQPSDPQWTGGDQEIALLSIDSLSDVTDDETLSYRIELRACESSASDAGSDADAASEDANLADAGLVDATPDDAQSLDGSGDAAMDAGLDDINNADDATLEDASQSDASSADAAELNGASLCNAQADYAMVASGSELPLRAAGLVNGQQYEVRVYVVDGAGNVGTASDASLVTPQNEYGFWDVYDGAETGFGQTSCQQARPSLAWLLLGLPLLVLWRRRRQRHIITSSMVILLSVLSFAPAQAKPLDWSLRLAGGPYLPDIDTEPGANGAYACIFGQDPWVLGDLSADLILFDAFGSLSLGAEMSYFTKSGKERDAISADGSCGAVTSSSNTLHLLPLSANLQYRFDWLYKMVGLPLAPYGRIGLIAAPWSITRNGLLEKTGGSLAGLRTGWQWAAGLALVLDIFEPAAMARVRETGTFQHSYLFAEWREMHIDGFGTPGFILGDQTWMAGIAVDF